MQERMTHDLLAPLGRRLERIRLPPQELGQRVSVDARLSVTYATIQQERQRPYCLRDHVHTREHRPDAERLILARASRAQELRHDLLDRGRLGPFRAWCYADQAIEECGHARMTSPADSAGSAAPQYLTACDRRYGYRPLFRSTDYYFRPLTRVDIISADQDPPRHW
jgi:hypothetical protein